MTAESNKQESIFIQDHPSLQLKISSLDPRPLQLLFREQSSTSSAVLHLPRLKEAIFWQRRSPPKKWDTVIPAKDVVKSPQFICVIWLDSPTGVNHPALKVSASSSKKENLSAGQGLSAKFSDRKHVFAGGISVHTNSFTSTLCKMTYCMTVVIQEPKFPRLIYPTEIQLHANPDCNDLEL